VFSYFSIESLSALRSINCASAESLHSATGFLRILPLLTAHVIYLHKESCFSLSSLSRSRDFLAV
jgi:hypothetical protein